LRGWEGGLCWKNASWVPNLTTANETRNQKSTVDMKRAIRTGLAAKERTTEKRDYEEERSKRNPPRKTRKAGGVFCLPSRNKASSGKGGAERKKDFEEEFLKL